MMVSSLGYQVQRFSSAEEFLSQLQPGVRGCIIADVKMEGISGIDLVQRITKEGINLPVVVVTGYADVSMAVQAMQAGAITFLEKPCVAPEIQESIRISLEKEEQVHNSSLETAELRSRLATLNDSEKLVLEKILEGKPNKVIKKELDIGLRTAELRRSNVMKKMQATSLAELVRMAVAAGITTESSTSSETDSHLVAE